VTTPDEAAFRTDPPYVAGEREMLQGWLDYHRGTLLWKAAGLTGEQLVTASVDPSTLSLLGLIRHMVDVERWWFQRCVAGLPVRQRYWTDEYPDGDFDLVDPARVAEDLAELKAQITASDQVAAELDLDFVFRHPKWKPPTEISLRWVYVHLIEEYARHNGHADLLRERIDGATGE
jgi:Protein of unknown function (DUF664)